MKKLVRRALADTDILAALDYYIANAPEYALSFLDALEHTYQHIQISKNFLRLALHVTRMN